jgi:signal transduction histidine kinase
MTTQTRLFALLCLLLGVFAVSIVLLRRTQSHEGEVYLAQVEQERGALTDRVLDLTGQSLRGFAADYSNWDEMLQFVDKPDPAWAAINIDASLPNFNAHAAWVICPDGKLIHSAVRKLDETWRTTGLPVGEMLPLLRREPFEHFFLHSAEGLLEIRTAPIQPSADTKRTTPPRGWFVVARLWDADYQKTLEQVLESEVHVSAGDFPARERKSDEVVLDRPLRDWQGRTIGHLRTVYAMRHAEAVALGNDTELLLFLGFGAVVIAAAAIGVSRWVVRPLHRLEQSLANNSPASLHALALQPDIFGRLATLVTASFEHRQELEREIEERRRAEAALHQSREELRQSTELKTRLARDLHDGVIQSIYAAGLGLEGVRATLRSDTEGAERRLDAAQTALNQTIREVRSFIQGLEPDETMRPDFTQVLRSLISTLQALHAVQFDLQIELAPATLSAREEVHALEIVRECVSNALRHGEARHIHVRLGQDAQVPVLSVRDDGRGFDPLHARRGSGLANLASRAAEIGAALQITSTPGKGADITLRFAQRKTAP